MTALDQIRDAGYRIGNLQAIRYDRTREDLFYDGYMGRLYFLLKECGRRGGDGILSAIFGGNPTSTFDAIVPFLVQRPLIILGAWEDGSFKEAGVTFPIIFCGSQQTEVSAFCGFGFLPWVYGSDEINTLSILGLAMLYRELNLVAIHGTRYPGNTLAKQFMERFGFHDVGTLPHYQLRDGKLVPTMISTLSREDFEKIAAQFIPAEEEEHGEEKIEAQANMPTAEAVRALADGSVKAVWFPVGTREIPEIPTGMQSCIVEGGFTADGVWLFNPALTSEVEIWVTAGNNRHAELLAPLQPKEKPKEITLRVTRQDGSLVTKVTVEATAEAIEHAVADFPHFNVHVDRGEEEEQKPEKPGASGGKARAAKMTQEQRSESARRAAVARWKKDE